MEEEGGTSMKYVSVVFDATWCRAVFASAALLVAPANTESVWAQEQGQVYVSNYYGDSVTMYALNTAGERPPTLTVPTALGARPHQIAINHRAGELLVANNVAYSVSTFDRSTGLLKRAIAGPSTGIVRPTGLAIDEVHREIYVANDWAHSITVYDELAVGDVIPKRTITSSAMFGPVGLAVDLIHDEIVVAETGFHSILTFPRLANGPTDPKRQILGAGIRLPQGIALDLTHDEILVTNSHFDEPDRGAILAFNRTDNGILLAPLRKLEGGSTGLCNPMSVAIDFLKNEIVVANADFANGACAQSVTAYDRTANGNVAPKRSITGASTTLNYPTSAAIYYGGTLSVSNKASSSNVTAGSQVTYNITATATGGAILDARLSDTLPTAGGPWDKGGTDAAACTLDGNQLNCSFGNLAKGQSKTVKVFAATSSGNCSGGLSNQATVQFNDGTALLTGASPVATVNVKCR